MTSGDSTDWNDEARISCEFRFKCPKDWRRLERTERDEVRYCQACEREVYLAATQEALAQHKALGHCVAVPLRKVEGDRGDDEPHWAVGMLEGPYAPGGKPSP